MSMISGRLLPRDLTPANVDDRHPVLQMAQRLFGKLVGDKGYLSQDLVARLLQQGVELLTPLCKNMKPRLVRLNDKLLLRNRVLIETINSRMSPKLNTAFAPGAIRDLSPDGFLISQT